MSKCIMWKHAGSRIVISLNVCKRSRILLCWLCLLCIVVSNILCYHMLFTFLVPISDALYDLSIKEMFGSSLPSVVCRRAHALFMLFVFVFVYSGAQYVSTIWVSWQVSYKRQELLTIREHLHSSPVLGGSVFLTFFCVLFVFVLCVMCKILPIFMDCPYLIASSVFSNVYSKYLHVWKYRYLLDTVSCTHVLDTINYFYLTLIMTLI